MDYVFPEELEEEELQLEEMNEAVNEEPSGYRKSICFDEVAGDFKQDGTKKLMEADGVEAWIQWCMKSLQTKRYVCQAYSDDIGIDTDQIFQSADRKEVENLLRREIVDALEADPYGRTEMVQSVEFQWIDDTTVEVLCKIVGVGSNETELQTVIGK